MPSAPSREKLITIDRRSGLTFAEFVSQYRNLGKPVVFAGYSQEWSARKLFTFEFFEEHFGDRRLEVNGRTYTLREVLHLLKTPAQSSSATYSATLRRDEFADLQPYSLPRAEESLLDRALNPLSAQRTLGGLPDLGVFLGGPGGEVPALCYDHRSLYAYINQLHGDREFTLFPPEQRPYLYPNPTYPWLPKMADYSSPTPKNDSLLTSSTPLKLVVSAGETLFIPCGWSHTSRSLTLSISVAFDQLCCSNRDFLVDDCIHHRQLRPLAAKLIRSSLNTIGALLGAYEATAGKH